MFARQSAWFASLALVALGFGSPVRAQVLPAGVEPIGIFIQPPGAFLVIALIIAVIFGLVSPFLLSNEVGKLYERRGQTPPVTALTGLWFFPGIFILVGPFIWFVRTNNALNEYWRSQGVTRTTLV